MHQTLDKERSSYHLQTRNAKMDLGQLLKSSITIKSIKNDNYVHQKLTTSLTKRKHEVPVEVDSIRRRNLVVTPKKRVDFFNG